MKVSMVVDGVEKLGVIEDIYFIPDMMKTLLSVSVLRKKGSKIKLTDILNKPDQGMASVVDK